MRNLASGVLCMCVYACVCVRMCARFFNAYLGVQRRWADAAFKIERVDKKIRLKHEELFETTFFEHSAGCVFQLPCRGIRTVCACM